MTQSGGGGGGAIAGLRGGQLIVELMASDPSLEFFLRRPEIAELIDGRRNWREGENVKRLGKHLLQVGLGCDADGDMGVEVLAGRFRTNAST